MHAKTVIERRQNMKKREEDYMRRFEGRKEKKYNWIIISKEK